MLLVCVANLIFYEVYVNRPSRRSVQTLRDFLLIVSAWAFAVRYVGADLAPALIAVHISTAPVTPFLPRTADVRCRTLVAASNLELATPSGISTPGRARGGRPAVRGSADMHAVQLFSSVVDEIRRDLRRLCIDDCVLALRMQQRSRVQSPR